MVTVKIEHAIRDFGMWRAAFDRDPVGRRAAGVRCHRIYQGADDPKYVFVDLDFDDLAHATAFIEKLRQVWRNAEQSPALARSPGAPHGSPRAMVVSQVEVQSY